MYDQSPPTLDAIDAGAVAWILAYWVRKLGREPDADEIEPLTRAWWDATRGVTAADYLLAVQDAQALSRTLARFFTDIDLWLTPTLAEPPVPVGEISGTADDPDRVMQQIGSFIGFPAWVANATGNPAMSVPLALERRSAADRRPLSWPLRRRSHTPAARRPTRTGSTLVRATAARTRIHLTAGRNRLGICHRSIGPPPRLERAISALITTASTRHGRAETAGLATIGNDTP